MQLDLTCCMQHITATLQISNLSSYATSLTLTRPYTHTYIHANSTTFISGAISSAHTYTFTANSTPFNPTPQDIFPPAVIYSKYIQSISRVIHLLFTFHLLLLPLLLLLPPLPPLKQMYYKINGLLRRQQEVLFYVFVFFLFFFL